MKPIHAMVVGVGTLVMAASSAPATIYVFAATLSGGAEVPANASLATGQIVLQFNDVTNFLNVSETFSGLTTNATGAHIHCCAGPTANAGIAVDFSGFPSATSGSYSLAFDLANNATFTNGFRNANGGTAAGARTALLAGLLGGQAYANIHNAAFPGGEIRGQLAAVPEPASWALMVAGFGLTGAALRRRRVRIAMA